jgi:16S rRNA (cytosine967-C5)-methyltransferase
VATAFDEARGRDFSVVPAADLLTKAGIEGADALVSGNYLRLWPDRNGTDAFFAAVWQRS